jgi:hypothetical protein
MAYRGSYRSNNWSQWHESKLRQQQRELGGIDDEVREAFLALPKDSLLDFFFHYERRYGSGARAYAEKAVFKWRTGNIRMSAQTTERLLQILPPFLGAPVKHELLRKLRERYRESESLFLEVTTLNYRSLVMPLVERLIFKAYSANLPADLEARLAWLSDDDATAAKALLAGAEAAAMAISVGLMDQEFLQMESLLIVAPKGQVAHRIELPYGLITLSVKRGKPMDQKKSEIISRRTIDSTTIANSDGLLKNAIRNLNPDQLSEVLKTAADEDLKLQIGALQSDQRFSNAARDIDNFVDTTRRLDQMQSDYQVSGTFNTASGTTSVTAQRNRSMTWIIVVIALAILVVLLIMKR